MISGWKYESRLEMKVILRNSSKRHLLKEISKKINKAHSLWAQQFKILLHPALLLNGCNKTPSFKVQLFWESHKNLRNLPYGFDIYLVNVKTIRQFAQIFVAFSEKLNFK